MKKIISAITLMTMVFALTACTGNGSSESNKVSQTNNVSDTNEISSSALAEANTISDIIVQFGQGGPSYKIVMEENDTARELARNVTDSGRNLPIYDYDNFEGYQYFQYYDIPTRYKIPANPVSITSAKAGEVYYSDPNRVILFYQDAEVSGDYTKVGTIEDISGLKEAVEENPVLEGWGNKLILLTYAN